MLTACGQYFSCISKRMGPVGPAFPVCGNADDQKARIIRQGTNHRGMFSRRQNKQMLPPLRGFLLSLCALRLLDYHSLCVSCVIAAYDWTLGQILPRSREEGCQQGLTESSVKGKTRVYREGNLTVDEYTYGITRRESKPYGHLAEYRGWPKTRAS